MEVSLFSAGDVDIDMNNNLLPAGNPFQAHFSEQGGARIGFLRVVNCDGEIAGDRVTTGEAASWMRAIYPSDPEKLVYQPIRFAPMRYPVQCPSSPKVVVDAKFYTTLEQERLCSERPLDTINAWLKGGALGKAFGRCPKGTSISVASDDGTGPLDSRWRQTLAHETTHCLLSSTKHFEEELGSANLGELGFDVEGVDPLARQVMAKAPDGKTLVDYMSNGKFENQTWITLATFGLLEKRLASHQPPKSTPAQMPFSACDLPGVKGYLGVRGVIRQQGAEFFPFLMKSPLDALPCRNETAPSTGQYELRFLSKNPEKICQVIRFEGPSITDESDERPFFFTVPNYPELELIELNFLGPEGVAIPKVRVFRGKNWDKSQGQDLDFSATVQKKIDSAGSTALLHWKPILNSRLEDAESPLNTAGYHVYFTPNDGKN